MNIPRPDRRTLIIIAIVLALLLPAGYAIAASVQWHSPGTTTSHYDAPSGPSISESADWSPTSQVPIRDGVVDFGVVEFRGSGEATVSTWSEEKISIEDISTASTLEIHEHTKQRVDVSGIDSITFSEVDLHDDTVTEISTVGSGEITIYGLPDEAVVLNVDGDEQIADSTADSTTVSVDGETDIRLYHTRDPDLTDPQPTDGEVVSEAEINFSVHVDDPDFDADGGDSVTVDFYVIVDGEETFVGSDTVTSSERATATWDDPIGGNHEWYAEAEDDYSNSDSIAPQKFGAPDTLRIYNETAPTQLVDEVEVELRFFLRDDTNITTRTTNTGEIDMTGLPAGEQFIVVANADGYDPRRIYIRSLAESQQVYLLPDSADRVEIKFMLEDYTGDFPRADSVLEVQRALDDEWRTVQGDFFGATGGWEATLQRNIRHRLVIVNTETGDTKPLGDFTPVRASEETVEVDVGADIPIQEQLEQIVLLNNVNRVPATSGVPVSVAIREGEYAIESWEAEFRLDGENGTETLTTITGTGPTTIEEDFDLTNESGTLAIDVTLETEDGRTVQDTMTLAVGEHFDNPHSLVGVLSAFGEIMPSGAQTMVAFLSTVLVTGAVASTTRASTEMNGLVALGTLAVFSLIGWIGMGVFFATLVAVVAMAALRRRL